jgi:hypothetical protein
MFPYKFQVKMVLHVHSIDLFELRAMMIAVKPMAIHAYIEIPWRQRNSFEVEDVRLLLDLVNNYVVVWHNHYYQQDLYYV